MSEFFYKHVLFSLCLKWVNGKSSVSENFVADCLILWGKDGGWGGGE